MPFGLKNAPAVFQSLMDRVLGPLTYVTAIAYLDDVIIHSSSVEQHVIDLENVLRRIQAANLSINKNKCAFGMKSVEFLGFIVSDQGISANPDKIKPIQVIPAPTNIKEIEQFLGVCGVYQKFISNFQIIAEPLRRLKKKDIEFHWGDEQQQAFEAHKARLASLPTLIQPDFSRPFELHCDAATTCGIGVILCQRDDEGSIYPVSFSSRSLTKFEQKYSIRELEALSIVWGIKKHRIYLESGHFTVYTDHSSLQWLFNTNQDKQPRLWRWCLFLQAYDFEVKYVPGHKNVVADMLSRNPLLELAAISTIVPWSNEAWWIQEQGQDSELATLINGLKNGTCKDTGYHLHKGILCKIVKYAKKINHYKVAPAHKINTIIEYHHSSQFAGHGGSNKTQKSIQNSRIYFSGMDKKISLFTKACLVCQRIKGDRSLQFPLASTVGSFPFQKIAFDYFGALPTSDSNNKYILVIIDTFTSYVELYPLESTSSMELAKTFYHGFILRHGIPEICLQDNGSSFASEFNQQLAVFSGIELQFTPPYFASANGLVERFMKTLRQMLVIYCNQDTIKTTWDKQLRLIRFVYNNMYHSSIKTNTFELVHGRKARQPVFVTDGEEDIKFPASYKNMGTPQLHFAKELLSKLNNAFKVVYNEMKSYESSQDHYVFKQGDKVLLFNMQLSTSKKPRKLAFDWYGPFIIESVLSNTRFNLKHEETGKKLSNMHVSLIKPFYECNLLY